LKQITSEPYWDAKDPAAKNLMVQVPIVATQSLSTTASIPDGLTLIIAGLVDDDVVVEGKPAPVSRQIFLLVKPSLIVQREIAAR